MKKLSVNAALRASVAPAILGAALIAAPAIAQDTPQAADTAEAEAPTIVVTGTLIKNPNLQLATPVNVTSSDTIELRQNNVAEEVLRDIPGIVPSIGSAVNNGNGGASYVDLRGLGSNRNLVLLDGDRVVPADLAGRVDLNNIPLALVERVENLTGGASTTYGADAITGVVNFVTRKDFQGVELSLGERITGKGDGNYFRGDLTLGTNFDDGRGNATLSIGYQEAQPVYQGDRDFSVNNIDSFSGTFGGSGTSVPSRFGGTRPIDPATGRPSTNPAVANGGVRQIDPATGQAVPTYQFFNFNPYNIFQTPFRRFNAFSTAHYEVADNIEVYSRALFSKNHVNTIIAPSGSFGGTVTIPLSNPYLPAALRNQFCAFNVAPAPLPGEAPTYTPRFTQAQCDAAATATSPTDPNFRSVTVTLNRRATEVGPRLSDFQTTVFDYRFGVRGDITSKIQFDVSGAYGESENIQTQQNYTLQSRLRSAVYATNTTTCLPGAPGGADIAASTGCVPINIFGPDGSILPNQISYLTANSTTALRTSLAQAKGIVSGDTGIASPFASDGINFATGVEYRKYRASQASDTLSQTPGELGGSGGAAPVFAGGYSVVEGIGELNIPLVQDKPFFESLSLETGIRYSSYKVDAPTSPSYNTTTYKVNGIWAPVKDFKFRGGYSHSVRAPNINELFAPQNTGLTNLSSDPCAGAAPTTDANLRAICLAQGAPAGSIGSITNPTAGQANSTTTGNINLQPETSDSYTIGTVITPNIVPGLAITVDYYNIAVLGAITAPTPNDALDACFNGITAASASSPACTIIRRNPSTGGLDGDPATTGGLFQGLSNSGKLVTDGIDFAVNYVRPVGFAKLNLSFIGNYTLRSKFKSVASNPLGTDRECVGYYSVDCSFTGSLLPRFQFTQRTTLSLKQVDLSLQWRHISGLSQEPGSDEAFHGALPDGTIVDFRKIPSYDYFDLTARFDISKSYSLTLTVTNLADRKPPLVGSTIGSTAFNSGNTYPSTYDGLGRRFAATVKIKL